MLKRRETNELSGETMADADNPNLAHRIAVLRRELAEERRATESAVELLRVISDAYQAAKDVPHPLPGRECWISRDLWIAISTFVALDDDRRKHVS